MNQNQEINPFQQKLNENTVYQMGQFVMQVTHLQTKVEMLELENTALKDQLEKTMNEE